MNKIIIICGPTASGKSEIAHDFAKNNNASVINIDSQQIYKDFDILTASPNELKNQSIDYFLYNFLDINQNFSVGKYIQMLEKILKDQLSKNILPVLVGGTGLYIDVLLNGVSNMPNIDESVILNIKRRKELMSKDEFYENLINKDPNCKKININDTHRLIRAAAVLEASSKSIFEFRGNKKLIMPNIQKQIIYIKKHREIIYKKCHLRAKNMIELGAIKEVENALNKYAHAEVENCKIIGVKEILSYLEGKITKDKLIELISQNTRRYAKKQFTWFNNKLNNKNAN